jgi:ABC-2 type transport system ATP-binding protein
MKRRLDLALALVHRPRVLFLDEPTTGLDIQSRTALWHEVRSLARDDGVTVFLTTQYLDEADALADHVDIINAGRIVASDTPHALKAEFGRPTVIVRPVDEANTGALAAALAEFGRPSTAGGAAEAVQLLAGVDLSDIVRALDGRGIAVAELRLQAPSLDDVFLAKTGHSLEGASLAPAGPAGSHDGELVP